MKRLITIILLAVGLQVSGQYKPMVGQFRSDTTGGERVEFLHSSPARKGQITEISTPRTVSDSLKNYAKLQDGLIDGGDATIGTGSVTIDTAYYRLRDTLRMSLPRTFSGITNSPTGTQYYLLVYGNASGLLDTISGTRDTIAVMPNNPPNTVKINTVLVGDGGVESAQPDLSIYATLGANTFTANQKILGNMNSYSVSANEYQLYRSDFTGTAQKFVDYSPITFNQSSLNLYSQYGYANPVLGLTLTGDSIPIGVFAGRAQGQDPIGSQDFVTKSYGDANYSGGGSSYTFTSPLSETGGAVSIANASTSTTGVLTSTDWNTFNSKAPATGGAGYIQNGTGLQSSSNFYISGTGRATNFGAGISPNANARYVAAAGTSTIGQFLWTPSASYAGTENGMMNYNSGDSTLRLMRFGSSDQVIFNNNNPSLKLAGLPRLVETNSSGALSATKPIVSLLVTDTDVISAITGGTYTSDRATITPASSKVMYIGQIYDDGTYTYIAIDNNVVRRW